MTLGANGNRKWVVPGVADLNNGTANWQTDMRVFNAGATDVPVTLSFYSQNGGAPKVTSMTLQPGDLISTGTPADAVAFMRFNYITDVRRNPNALNVITRNTEQETG